MAAVTTGPTVALGDGHVPFTVTATLRSGVSMDEPYGLDLAGLIATRLRALARAQREAAGRLVSHPLPDTTHPEPDDMALPLSRCLGGEDWHWLASCAIPVDPAEDPEARTFYRVVDSSWAQRAAQRPLPYQHPGKGPHRDIMLPSPVMLCRALQWRAVGDPVQVHELLRTTFFIGRRRAVGEGKVLSWEVELAEDVDPSAWVHAEGDQILRPVPAECAEALEVPYRMGMYAVRPPSWHPDLLQPLAMTDDEDDW